MIENFFLLSILLKITLETNFFIALHKLNLNSSFFVNFLNNTYIISKIIKVFSIGSIYNYTKFYNIIKIIIIKFNNYISFFFIIIK